jgi:hypothetical protein
MLELESPTCALDLRHPSNSLATEMAKPREEIRVIARVEDNGTAAKLMEGMSAHSNDGSPSLSWSRERMARNSPTTSAIGNS